MTHPQTDARRDELVARLVATMPETMEAFVDRQHLATCMLFALEAAGVDLGGWMPIESAPKDGTRVLAWSANWTGVMTVQYYGTDWRPDYTLRLKYQPTHWRPLPKGPAHE